jgi:hypothetical protein
MQLPRFHSWLFRSVTVARILLRLSTSNHGKRGNVSRLSPSARTEGPWLGQRKSSELIFMDNTVLSTLHLDRLALPFFHLFEKYNCKVTERECFPLHGWTVKGGTEVGGSKLVFLRDDFVYASKRPSLHSRSSTFQSDLREPTVQRHRGIQRHRRYVAGPGIVPAVELKTES